MSGSCFKTAAQHIWTDLPVRHRHQVNWRPRYPQQADIVSYPTPKEHYHILRYTIRNEGVKHFTKPMNHWPLAGTMTSGKNHEGPVISKIFTVLSSYKSTPPSHRSRFTHSFAVVVKCFSIYLMNFLLQCSKSLKQESNPSMRTKNSVGVILQEPSIHHSPSLFLSTALCILAQLQLFSAVSALPHFL